MNPALLPCEFCGAELDGRAYRWVSGWAQARSQGGTNALKGKLESDRWACRICIEHLKAHEKASWDQPPLW